MPRPSRPAKPARARHSGPGVTGGRLAWHGSTRSQGITIESGGCLNEPECEDTPLAASSLQSETTIAVDATGQHVVVGFNDFRGFRDPSTTITSISGFMYSDDGGQTFTDGGQLPSPGSDGRRRDGFRKSRRPDSRHWAVHVRARLDRPEKFGAAGVVQSMVVHRSTDCGHTGRGR
jgi:hypothetical protein